MKKNTATITAEETISLLTLLRTRFERNMKRHSGLDWHKIQAKLEDNPNKLLALQAMESTGGEPDVIAYDSGTDSYHFYDCAAESPKGRRSTCYDIEAQESRKEHRPENNAVTMAAEIGITLLTEEQYRYLQQLDEFDLKTSSWLTTPAEIRERGGAIFGDRRYDQVFVYHNGVQSYYAARGFRGMLVV